MTSASTSSDPLGSPGAIQEPAATMRRTTSAHLPRRPLPKLGPSYIRHGSPSGPVLVVASQSALRQIGGHATSNLHSEMGGGLLGRAYATAEQIVVEVHAAVPVNSQDFGPIHFTFSADSFAQLQRDRDDQYPDLEIVGWFHTHPGLGVFYSGDDVIVHSAAFTLPWHIGLVLDPVRQQGAFFGWQGQQIVPFTGYYEWARDNEADNLSSVVDWQVVPTTVWHAGHEPSVAQPDEVTAKAVSAITPRTWSRWQLALPLVIAGLLGPIVILLTWNIHLALKVNYLETSLLAAASVTLAETNAASCPDQRVRILVPISGQQMSAQNRIRLLGTADVPGAVRYRTEIRRVESDEWELLGTRRWDTTLGRLATWDAGDHESGAYEVRLTAVDRNNVRLAAAPSCRILVELSG